MGTSISADLAHPDSLGILVVDQNILRSRIFVKTPRDFPGSPQGLIRPCILKFSRLRSRKFRIFFLISPSFEVSLFGMGGAQGRGVNFYSTNLSEDTTAPSYTNLWPIKRKKQFDFFFIVALLVAVSRIHYIRLRGSIILQLFNSP